MTEEYTIGELEKKIGYQFRDKSLLKQALTHSSFANEQRINKLKDYERLEFLGDAVLELISSDFLFHENPQMPEGKLTKLRSSMVCEPALAYCARDIELGRYMLLGKGEEATGGRNCIWTAVLTRHMILSTDSFYPIWKIKFCSMTARRCCRKFCRQKAMGSFLTNSKEKKDRITTNRSGLMQSETGK